MPKLSVVMPVYNSASFLRKSIQSILNQTYKDFELFLVNDGSKDESLEICREFERVDSRVKVIDKENEGAGPTRNRGIKETSGEYIVFPDSDDWLDVDAYEKCLQEMEEKHLDLLIFGMRTHVYNNQTEEVEKVIEDSFVSRDIYGDENCKKEWINLYKEVDLGSPCNKVYRRSVIIENKIEFPPLRRMQDCVFNLYYYDKIKSVSVLDKNFFNRRWHTTEFQRRKMPKDLLDCAIFYQKTVEQSLQKWGTFGEEEKKIVYQAFMDILHTIEFEHVPVSKQTFLAQYKHIKDINNHPYVHDFLIKYSELKGKIRKKEIAMKRRWNFLLAIVSYKK